MKANYVYVPVIRFMGQNKLYYLHFKDNYELTCDKYFAWYDVNEKDAWRTLCNYLKMFILDFDELDIQDNNYIVDAYVQMLDENDLKKSLFDF